MNPSEIKERLARDIDVSQMPEVLREEIMKKLEYSVMRKLVTEIMKRVPENRLQEFTLVNDGGDPAKTQAFLSKFIRDLDGLTNDIIQQEVDLFKKIHNLG
jgi:hypothetical protein